MAWTKRELFSFARKCEYFSLRLESGLAKKRSRVVFVLANYGEKLFDSTEFPASVIRKAFEYAQQRANEVGSDVRIVMSACVDEEYAEPYGDDYEGLFAVATVKPSKSKNDYILSTMPVVHCSMCSKTATHKMVRYSYDGASVIEHGCAEHIDHIRGYWA